jgi:hypothetical protein
MAGMATKNTPTRPNWISLVHKQICRYYPNDERPAKSKAVAVYGPMLTLAIELGIRGWDEKARVPLSVKRIAELREAGAFREAAAFADFEIDDEESGAQGVCLWWLTGRDASVEFISPGYEKLQAQRARDIDRNKVAKASRKPKPQTKDMKTRGDIL